MKDLIYLNDDFDSIVKRILIDGELKNCGLNEEKVSRTLKSFCGDEIACSVFFKKYALRNEENNIIEFTLDEAKKRWADCVYSAEKVFKNPSFDVSYFKELYEYMLPAGRQMFALGNDYISKATYTNCYVTKIEEDSLEGIYNAGKKLARTYSYGGGVGLCIGELRPSSSKVANSARFSSGSVSFMELYSMTTGLIGQSGRRAALMITIPVHHPDVEEFIEIKHDNIDKVKHANVSIKLTDEFMNAVVNDELFTLAFETRHETIKRVVKARDLWNKIVKSARDSAEPGILFWDRMVEMSPSDTYDRLKIHSTNPCVTGDTLVATPNGWRRVDEIMIGDYISTVTGCGRVEKIEVHENMQVFEVEFNDGTIIKATAAHQFHVTKKDNKTNKYSRKYTPTRLDEIEAGDFVRVSGFSCYNSESKSEKDKKEDFERGLMSGILLGDGCYTSKTTAKNTAKIASSIDDVEWNEIIIQLFKNKNIKFGCNKATDGSKTCNFTSSDGSLVKLINQLNLPHVYSFQKELPSECYTNNNKEFNCGILSGLFSTDGNVNLYGDAPQIRLKSTSKKMLLQVKQILLSFNVFSTLYNAGKTKKILGRSINSRDRFEIIIGGQSVKTFINKIGVFHPLKNKICQDLLLNWSLTGNTWKTKIKSVTSCGFEKVYDLYEPITDTWIINGIISKGCGEQSLESGGTCVLASLLLHKFVVNSFTDGAYFDFGLFEEMVTRGVRHLDNVVELNIGKHALQEQEDSSRLGRRIGLGITGLADMYAALGIRYDSDEALEIVSKIIETKKIVEYKASINLAKERGSFPLFDAGRHFERSFAATLPDEIKELAKQNGLRNVAISTIAPSGSLSIIAQCSSGIEPIFALSYLRSVEMGSKNKKKFKIMHPGLSRFHAIKGYDNLPEFWVVAHQIDYKYRVKLQGILQRHIDASISSTINLPAYIDVDTVSQIYLDAWKEGLKGITVYREGAREGVLITDEYAKAAGVPDMNTVVHCIRAEGGDKFYTIISYKNGDIKNPYQVFVMNYKQVERDAFVKIGNSLVRMLREKGVSEDRIKKYISRSQNPLAKLTRFLSLSMKTDYLAEAVEILNEHAFAGTLASKLYEILYKSLQAKKAICQNKNCGSSNVKREEGCMICLDCGWSGCA